MKTRVARCEQCGRKFDKKLSGPGARRRFCGLSACNADRKLPASHPFSSRYQP